ncbi:MAG: fibronectin type 3 domain-containing protein [Pirellulaceae bacterium]|jgi:fibronectin type 3 domain-containing protein
MKSANTLCTWLALVVLLPLVLAPIALLPMGATAANADWSDHPVNQWVKQSPRDGATPPSLQYEGSGAIDPIGGRWIHFGGHDGIPQGFYLFTCDIGSGRWQQWFPNTSPPGVCCVDGSNTFDVAQRRFVAFPGGSLGHGYQWSRGVKLKQSNAWLYDPQLNEWTNMRPPPYQRPEKYSRDLIGGLNSAATYDANHEVTISFGGQGAGGPTNALFVYDAYSNRLEQRQTPDPPSPRDGMGMCYDTKNDCLVMFGSQYSDDERTWLYRLDANRWEGHQTDPHPPGKKEGTYSTNPKMAFDDNNGVCLCVVRRGETSGQPIGSLETWALDVGEMKWTKMEPPREPDPSASRARNFSYWPQQNLFVLETVAADKSGPQIWTYRYAKRGEAQPLNPPVNLQVTTLSLNGSSSVKVAWQHSASDSASYNVYRAKSATSWDARFASIANTKASSYTDDSAIPGHVYFYNVTAVAADGRESRRSALARNQPRTQAAPVVSVLSADRIEIDWTKHSAKDVVGYNLYRGVALVDTVKRGEPKAWSDNDPEYSSPVVVAISDITDLRKLNAKPLATTHFADSNVDLSKSGASSADYKYAVYAYIVRAVNRVGVESGPSPYALTIPSAPQHVMLREGDGSAELRWQASREKGVVGYHIYKLGKSHWEIVRVTNDRITETSFVHKTSDTTRYWVVPIDRLGQEGEPSSPVWYRHAYNEFFSGEWHQ